MYGPCGGRVRAQVGPLMQPTVPWWGAVGCGPSARAVDLDSVHQLGARDALARCGSVGISSWWRWCSGGLLAHAELKALYKG